MMTLLFCAFLQDELTADKAEDLFVEAYKEYLAEDRDSSTAKFRKIFEKFGKEPIGAIAAYNIACNYAIDGADEESFKWIRSALEAGYDNFEHLESDSDLDAVRELKGWAEAVEAAKKKAPKEKRAPVREEDAPKIAERLIKAHKDGDDEAILALSSRLGWFAHAKSIEWVNAALKKKGYRIVGEGRDRRIEKDDY